MPRSSSLPPLPDPQQPDPDSGPGETAPAPGWASLPDPGPSQYSPDQQDPAPYLPDGEDGGASGSRKVLTPASFKSKAAAYAAIARALLAAVGGMANAVGAVDEDDLTWLPDADDNREIPDPLGRLAARRIPLGDVGENFSDLADLGQLAVGLAAYLAKGAAGWVNARRDRRKLRGVAVRAEGLEDADDAGQQ